MASLHTLALRNFDNIDLTPLADLQLQLFLSRASTFRGVDRLGPGVRVKWF